MTHLMLEYLGTAVILTLFIPVFGWIMDKVIFIIYSMIAAFLGSRITYILFNRIAFVGVFHHELSHALLATITGAKVKKIVFFHPQGDRLGYVEYSTRGNIILRSIQNTMTSIAPVLCGALTSGYLYHFITTADLAPWMLIVLVYCLVSIVIHMTMSKQDFKVMWKGIPVVYVIILIILVLTGFRIHWY